MFNFFKKNSANRNNSQQSNDDSMLSTREFINELEKKFPEHINMPSDLIFDECFWFIYRNIRDLKDSFIISSVLRQIEPSIDEVKLAYSVEDEYVNNLIKKIPQLRVLAYQRLEELPNEELVFFPGLHNNFDALYKELIDRIDYLLELRRNTNKVLAEPHLNPYFFRLINNRLFLFLLNFLSVKDALIIASLLNIIDIHYEEVQAIYPFDYGYFEEVFNRNISMIKRELAERIEKLVNIEIETSYFDYDYLCYQYRYLYERINDVMIYLNNEPPNR